ncbi:MAG: hypothetical protein DI624_12930 [Brevundimonas sp.]|nr:MAG: hypothetical protein DI624_12930 [Brevundimonas sp.]
MISHSERQKVIRTICKAACAGFVAEGRLEEREARVLAQEVDALITAAGRRKRVTAGMRTWKRIKPFSPVIATVVMIVFACLALGLYILWLASHKPDETTLVSAAVATMAVAAAAIGWAVAGWVSHRNSRVQHTINLLFARVSQPTFAENTFAFHEAFGLKLSPMVYISDLSRMENSKNETDRKAAQSVKYILNYFEFVAAGITRGDLDLKYVDLTMRGQIKFYYDKCEPLIIASQDANPKTLENLSKLRDYYRHQDFLDI